MVVIVVVVVVLIIGSGISRLVQMDVRHGIMEIVGNIRVLLEVWIGG